jgi:superfamily I DNA/RNA helicase
MVSLNTLNPQQRLAVEAIKGAVLILAGAGTGKTRVITFRIAYMIERGIPPGNILAVTFTNKAAREMQERVAKLIPRSAKPERNASSSDDGQAVHPERPTVCTFHSLCVRILRQHIEKLGYKRNFVIYDEAEQLGAVKRILAQISAKGTKLDPSAVLGALSQIRNGGGRAATFVDKDEHVLARHIRRAYESALRSCNAVDFDDLILLTLRLFEEHPEALKACRAKYRYVMVDEYQDTNAAQFKLVHSLAQEHGNLCVVGDDDQSIYGWRGAEVSNLLDMEKYFPDVKVIKLEQNYRSTNTILNAANALIKHNVRRREKRLWSQKGDGPKITLYAFDNDEEEARSVVERIEFLRLTRRVPWSDHAILFRTNIQSRPLEIALRKEAVPYHLIGGQSFFDRREVRDLLAYLKMFFNPHDDISLLRIANVPARGLSEVTMERLLAASHERKCSVYTAMKNPLVTATFQAKAREAIEQFVQFIDATRGELQAEGMQRDPRSLQTWAERFLERTGYLAELRRTEKKSEDADARTRNLKDLVGDLDGTKEAFTPPLQRLETFLEEITLDNEKEEKDETLENAVTLITIHSCKGLEFPHVYIVGLENGLLPHSRSAEEDTLAEERRLFYVAITRAMQKLTLSHCGGRKKYGLTNPCHPSPFLEELPQELIEHGDEEAKKPVAVHAGKSMFALLRDSLGE